MDVYSESRRFKKERELRMIHADSAREINANHKQQKLRELEKEPVFALLDKDIREAAEKGLYNLTYKVHFKDVWSNCEIGSALNLLYRKGRQIDFFEYLMSLGYDVQMTAERIDSVEIEISW